MLCAHCNHSNDVDAAFCDACGKPLGAASATTPARPKKAYWFIIALVPVLLLVGGFGYYKFFLPDGVAAVVNGEEIKLSELNAAIVRTQTAPESVTGTLRYQILNEMIAERLALQGAIKEQMSVSREEIAAAFASARSASGLDEKAFEKEMQSQYGSTAAFERTVERNLLIRKFINEKVVPSGADPMTARAALSSWLQESTGRSTIRIALAENGSTAGCGSKAGCGNNCGMAGGQQQKQSVASQGPRCKTPGPAASVTQPKDQLKAAEAACLKYWQDKHGADTVTAKLTDFGCHVQVDIVKDNKSLASLRYQNGSITEL